ncbi:sensor domain CHASE2-containing protein [Paraburkholderia steynii]|uniref:Sensor domain CHASE2-containing protein n=2 Tax=Paraburkholderia steynii TaxID=1245441 RepID=A0A7Z7FH15_9BURK|nr:sensor domain CHASE2-containing protein [Paraburkholderia steynii]
MPLRIAVSGKKAGVLLPAVTSVLIGVFAAIAIPAVMGEDFAARESAKLYAPLDAWLYDEGSRKYISTVVIDDNSLIQADQTWPPTYSFYARLLRGISYYHPKAIFLDVILTSERNDPSIQRLVDTICKVGAAGARVYLAASRTPTGSLTLRPELQKVSGHCFTSVSVNYQPDEVDHLTWTYELASSTHGTVARSAALAIYDDVSGKSLITPTVPMAISWGFKPSGHGLRWVSSMSAPPGAQPDVDASAYCRSPHGALEMLPPGLQRLFHRDAQKPLCVFHDTVYAYDLANATPDDDRQISASLRDRIVMIGTSRTYTNDFVTSPLHDRIPGVYLHAMALDNLLTYGSNYKRAPGLTPTVDVDHYKLLGLGLVSLICVIAFRYIRKSIDAWLIEKIAPPSPPHAPPSKIYLVDTGLFVTSELHQEIQRDLRIKALPASKQTTSRRRHVTLRALAAFSLKAFFSVIAVAGLLLIGEHMLNIGYFSVISVATFSLAAEWFEWNEKLITWLYPEHGNSTHAHN